MNQFADYIKSMRNAQNISIRELCERTGIPVAKISHIENGYIMPDVLQLYALAKELNLSFDKLLGLSSKNVRK